MTHELSLLNVCVFQLRLKPNVKEIHLNFVLLGKIMWYNLQAEYDIWNQANLGKFGKSSHHSSQPKGISFYLKVEGDFQDLWNHTNWAAAFTASPLPISPPYWCLYLFTHMYTHLAREASVQGRKCASQWRILKWIPHRASLDLPFLGKRHREALPVPMKTSFLQIQVLSQVVAVAK